LDDVRAAATARPANQIDLAVKAMTAEAQATSVMLSEEGTGQEPLPKPLPRISGVGAALFS
jgi:hypothetical protein